MVLERPLELYLGPLRVSNPKPGCPGDQGLVLVLAILGRIRLHTPGRK